MNNNPRGMLGVTSRGQENQMFFELSDFSVEIRLRGGSALQIVIGTGKPVVKCWENKPITFSSAEMY